MILHFGAALFQLRDQHGNGFQQIDGLKSADDDRHAKLPGQLLVLAEAHDRADVAGPMKPCTRLAGDCKNQAHRRRNQHVRNQHGEVREPLAPGLPDRHRIGGRRGLKADAEEDDLPRGILARDLQRVHGRVNDAHIGAVGARLRKGRNASRGRAACRRKK